MEVRAPRNHRPRLILFATACLLVAGGVSACGGDEDEPAPSSVRIAGSDVRPKARARVRIAGAGSGFEKSVRLKGAGPHTAVLRIAISNAKREPTVRIAVPARPRKRIQATVGGIRGRPSAKVTLTSASDLTFQVRRIRYSCAVLPPTVCPVEERRTSSRYELDFVSPKETLPLIFELQVRAVDATS